MIRFLLILSFVFSPTAHAKLVTPLNEIYLVSALQELRLAKTAAEFNDSIGHDWKREDREALKRAWPLFKKDLTFSRRGDVVTFRSGTTVLEADYSQIAQKILVLNGQKVVLNTYETFEKQIERALRPKTSAGGSKWDLLLPRAEAIAPFLLGALGFVAMGVANLLIIRYGNQVLNKLDRSICWAAIEYFKNEGWKESELCDLYMKELKKRADEDPALTAAKNSIPEATPTDTPIETVPESCPLQPGEKEYKATYYLINEDIRVNMQATIEDKKISNAVVNEFGTSKQLAEYVLSEDNSLSEIKLPAERTGRDVDVTGAIPVPAATKVTSDPKLAAKQIMYKKIFAHFGVRLSVCRGIKAALDAVEAKREKQIEKAKDELKVRAVSPGIR